MPAAFMLALGAFRSAVNLVGWRILSGDMSQRWSRAATPGLSMTSTAAVRIENGFPSATVASPPEFPAFAFDDSAVPNCLNRFMKEPTRDRSGSY